MSSLVRWLKAGIFFSVVLFAGTQVTVARPAPSTDAAKPDFCAAPEYRQFDFWIGDWDVFDVDNPSIKVARARVDNPSIRVARARVERILDGCVLQEDYQDTNGLKGRSFSIYDTSNKTWRQSWVTNRGQTLAIEGGLQAGEMVLAGVDRAVEGKQRRVRGTWKLVDGGVRETAWTSVDGGETWNPYFDLLFRPVAEGVSSTGTAPGKGETVAIVAALDTRYQAAVQRNDADTMDGILEEDFILVTGTGKTYTKADLLKEARDGQVHYERQDDAEQTVRVWGDTAVITAKLQAKGTDHGKPFDYQLWFSDTYVRTRLGWRYVFGQASSPLSSPEQ
jgi:ketosteroid isomerase-like protein